MKKLFILFILLGFAVTAHAQFVKPGKLPKGNLAAKTTAKVQQTLAAAVTPQISVAGYFHRAQNMEFWQPSVRASV